MSSSQDELTSLPGNFFAAIYMALGWDELIPGWTHLSTWWFPCCYLHGFWVGWAHPRMNSSQYLVISLLLFTWLWGGMSSSRDELTSVPGNFLAALYMALGWDELIPGWTHLTTWWFPCCYLHGFGVGWAHPGMNSSHYLVISLLLFTWLWGGMSSSRDELISVPGNFLAALYMALGWDELILGWTHLTTW